MRPASLLPFEVVEEGHRAYLYARYPVDPSRRSGLPIRAVCLSQSKTGARRGESPRWTGFYADEMEDLRYLCHASNAYPELVAALRDCLKLDDSETGPIGRARALLLKLGEGVS